MDFAIARRRLLESCLIPAGIHDHRLLRVMGSIPRHRFVQSAFALQAYSDNSLPIGHNQTISRPSIVARMLQSLSLQRQERVLELGTGSAYQTAVLCQLVRKVYSVDVIEDFIRRARRLLAELECYNVTLKHVNGEIGLPSEAPFDAIVVSACMEKIPEALLAQLSSDGGRLVAPVRAKKQQRIRLVVKNGARINEVDLGECVFVPLANA